MLTWKEYLIMQFLNTLTFLIIQEFFWLKMRKKFDILTGNGKIARGKEALQKMHQKIKDWRQQEKEALLQKYKK